MESKVIKKKLHERFQKPIETLYIQHKLRRENKRLRITEIPPSIVLYVGVNPFPMGRHTAIDTREALL